MSQPASTATVLLLARDLLIASRITSLAKRLGVPIRVVRDPSALAEAGPAERLIVDLDLDGSIAAAVEWGRAAQRPVAGFVQHVHTERIREAREAGIKSIIPRSRLDAVLPELLKSPAA